jgi:hypothetical protein
VPSNQDKPPYQGRQSGKSSSSWFKSGDPHMHPKGYGASTGDGKTTDKSIVGRIVSKFLRGK